MRITAENNPNDIESLFNLGQAVWDELFAEIPESLLSNQQLESNEGLKSNNNGLDLESDEFIIYICNNPSLLCYSYKHR